MQPFYGQILLIDGDLSNYTKPEDEPLIKKHFPNSRIETILGPEHWVHAEQPVLFYKYIEQFQENRM